MIYEHTEDIKGTNETVKVMLVDTWDLETLSKAGKLTPVIKDGFKVFINERFLEENYYFKSSYELDGRTISYIIAHYPNFTFGIRLMASYEISKLINPEDAKENLVAVSKIIKDAHMIRTEKIIMEAGK